MGGYTPDDVSANSSCCGRHSPGIADSLEPTPGINTSQFEHNSIGYNHDHNSCLVLSTTITITTITTNTNTETEPLQEQPRQPGAAPLRLLAAASWLKALHNALDVFTNGIYIYIYQGLYIYIRVCVYIYIS